MKVTRRDVFAAIFGAVPAATVSHWVGGGEITDRTKFVVFILHGTDTERTKAQEEIESALDNAGLGEKELPRLFLSDKAADVKTVQ